MTHRKLVAGEVAGTYYVTEAVTEGELLQIAKRLAGVAVGQGMDARRPGQKRSGGFEFWILVRVGCAHTS